MSDAEKNPGKETGVEDTTTKETTTNVLILPQSTAKIMQTIFGDDVDNAVIGSYAESPVQYWPVKRFADMDSPDLPKTYDNYTCVGTYTQNSAGRANRRSNNCTGLYLVMLDDVGTKYSPPDGWLEPSYKMQTSISEEGIVNQQWGYFLDAPIRDIAFAKVFLKEMINGSGASDKVGDLARFIRLPGSNNKPKYAGQDQVVQLISWNPLARYSVETMLGWIGKSREELDAATVHTPLQIVEDTGGHPIVTAFSDCDLLLTDGPNDEGWLDVTCPWEERHTTAEGTNTGLLIRPNGSWHVHCFHSSCKPEGSDKFKDEEVIERLNFLGASLGESNGIDCANWAAMRTYDPPAVSELPPNSPEARYIFVMSEGMYWDSLDKALYTKDSIDTKWGLIYPGTRTRPKLTNVLRVSPNHRVVSGLGFHTTNSPSFWSEGREYVNTYTAPALEPIAGDVSLWIRLMQHIYGEYADLVIDHMAFTVQKPEEKIRWQVLVHGKPRTGKTLSIQPLKYIFVNACKTVDAVVDEKFDDAYVGSKVVVFEEIWGDRRNYNHLKSKLANDSIDTLNPKSKAKILQMNRYAMYMFSNHEDALSIDKEGDKLLVIKGPDRPLEPEFYTQYGTEIGQGSLVNRVYDFLLRRDVSTFSYGRLPVRTQAAIDMAAAAAPEAESVIQHAIEHGFEPFSSCHFDDIELREDCESFKTIGVAYETVRLYLSEKRVYGRATSIKSVLADLGFCLVRGQKRGYTATPAIYIEQKYCYESVQSVSTYDWMCKFYMLTDRQMTKDMRRYASKMGWTKESLLVDIAKKEQDWSILD